MVLYIIGLGLGDEKDITVRGLECAKKCSKLFLEYYTSVLGVDAKKLEQFYGIPVILADRTMVCIVTGEYDWLVCLLSQLSIFSDNDDSFLPQPKLKQHYRRRFFMTCSLT